MKIAIHSDPHVSLSAYGIQAKYLTDYLKSLGHQVIIVPKATFSYTHALEFDGYNYYPPMGEWGNEGMNALIKKWQPDIVLCMVDPWITDYKNTKKLMFWSPVDHDPIPPDELGKLANCVLPVAVTKFSQQQMINKGLNAQYCPYGIDTSILYPDDEKRKQFRNTLGLEDSSYLIGMVGVNQFERKGYSQAFQAFKIFKQKHPNAELYVHADPLDPMGVDLFEMGKSIGIDVIFPDVFVYREGIDTEQLAYVYNAMDVYLTTTRGEGFGIPVVEAQACGVPVISTKFMGLPEINPHGLHIKCQPAFTPHKSWQVVADIPDTVDCLEAMYYSEVDKKQLVEFASQYDFKNILPLLYKSIEAVYQLTNHEHKWHKLANHIEKGMTCPCTVPECTCGLVVTTTEPNKEVFGLYPNRYNGIEFDIEDDPEFGVSKIVINELHQYHFETLNLSKESRVIDIGAQVGIVSTYLAKKYGCGVIAFEPTPDNYQRLQRNAKAMGVDNLILPFQMAVYDGNIIKIDRGETGLTGSGMVSDKGVEAKSVTLSAILKETGNIDLLKVDCEGSEFEIFENLPVEDFKKIKAIRGEFHYIEGKDPAKLLEYIRTHVSDVDVYFSELTP